MTSTLIKGIVIGFAVAAPVGPIALLILRRSINESRLSGFVSGIGAATADLVCGIIATLCLTWVTAMIDSHRALFQLGGGIFMVWFGIHAFRAKSVDTSSKRPIHERNLFQAWLFTLLLTLSNPMTLLGMVAVVAAAGVGGPAHTLTQTAVLNTGIFTGSLAWWTLLSGCAAWFGRRLGNKTLHVLNMVAGVVILGFGTWQLIALLLRFL